MIHLEVMMLTLQSINAIVGYIFVGALHSEIDDLYMNYFYNNNKVPLFGPSSFFLLYDTDSWEIAMLRDMFVWYVYLYCSWLELFEI